MKPTLVPPKPPKAPWYSRLLNAAGVAIGNWKFGG